MSTYVSPAKRKKAHLWNSVYYIVAAMIIAVTIFCTSRGREISSTEAYGVTKDAQQKLEEGTEVRVDFTIPRNNFKGVTIPFYVESTKKYGNEILYFYLKDNTTGKFVSKYELYMKNTLPQVGNFIPLPFEESEGKKVSLYIGGRDIRVTPALRLSEKANMKSELFVGNRHRRAYSLVFSAVYSDHQAIDFQALVKGGIFFFLWVIVGIWPIATRKARKTAGLAKKKDKVKSHSIPEAVRRFKRPLLLLFLTLVYAFLAVFVYYNNIEDTMRKAQYIDVVTRDERHDGTSIVLDSADDVLTESFTAQEDKLSSISFEISAEKKDQAPMLHLQLFDVATEVVLHDEYIKVSSLPSSRDVWKVYLNTEYGLSANQDILIRIEPIGFTSSQVRFYTGEGKSNVHTMVGGKKTGNLPILSISYADYAFLRQLFICYSVLIYLFLVMVYFMIVLAGWNVQKIYIPVCIFLGILYMLIIPVYSVPDEYAHIDTAYSLSNRLMGIERPVGMDGCDYRREIDAETEEYFTYTVTTDDYRRLYKELFSVVPEQELTVCSVRSTDSNTSMIFFFPSALGIVVGRLLHLSTLPMYLVGRLFNLIAYVLLTYLAICRLPGIKEVFFTYTLLPIALQQAASFSYDSMLNAVSLLFIAYCVYFATTVKTTHPVDVFILMFTSLQIATVKGGVYIPLALLLLLIPLERRWGVKNNLSFYLMMGSFICFGFLQGNISSLLNRLLPHSGTRINFFTGTEVYTFGYLLHHPRTLVRLYGNTFFSEGSRLVYEFFGGKMGSINNVQMPWMYPCIFMLIFAFVVIKCRKDFSLRRVSRTLCAVIPILALLLIGFAMLLADTTRDLYYISGIQGRYYIPVMLIPILCLMKSRNKEKAQESKEKKDGLQTSDAMDKKDKSSWIPALLIDYCLIHIVFILNIVMIVLPVSKT